MYERTLDLRDYSLPEYPLDNRNLQAWLSFNGIDPHLVVQNSLMTVCDNHAELVCFDRTKRLVSGLFAAKNVRVFDIHTSLEEFGL